MISDLHLVASRPPALQLVAGQGLENAASTRPGSNPSWRRGLGSSGISWAQGLPFRASTMRSPAATLASRAERCVFASWTLMQRGGSPGGPDVGLPWVDDISGLLCLVRLIGCWIQPGKKVSYSRSWRSTRKRGTTIASIAVSRPKSICACLQGRLFDAVALRNTNNCLGYVMDPSTAPPTHVNIKAWATGLTPIITRPYRTALEKVLIKSGRVNDDVRSP